jgi:hypothetical protein
MLRYKNSEVTEQTQLLDTNLRPSAFGVDEQGELYIVNHNATIHRFNKSTVVTGTEEELQLPPITTSSHPNPFQGRATIHYTIPAPADVALEIFDLLGRRVRVLVNAMQVVGNHEAVFDAAGLPNGVYLYRLSVQRHGQHHLRMQKMFLAN